jgi:hypothetical protein
MEWRRKKSDYGINKEGLRWGGIEIFVSRKIRKSSTCIKF